MLKNENYIRVNLYKTINKWIKKQIAGTGMSSVRRLRNLATCEISQPAKFACCQILQPPKFPQFAPSIFNKFAPNFHYFDHESSNSAQVHCLSQIEES